MIRPDTLKRRKFIGVAAAASGSVISCGGTRNPWRFFTPEEAKTVNAICECIVPADQDPGADWARCVVFIDRQLTKFHKKFQPAYRAGIAAVDETARKLNGKGFTDLPTAQQTELLAKLEKNKAPADIWKNLGQSEFFSMVVDHTMQGFYGGPRHGGNRDAASWKILGVPEPPIRGRQHYEFVEKS